METQASTSTAASEFGRDEAAMLASLQAGDEAAFERLVRTYGGRMLAVAKRMLGQDEDARDAVQEAFLSAFRSIGRFEQQSRLSTWLHRIVTNVALMKLRSRQRKPERSIEDLLPRFLADGHQADPALDWSDSAETAALKREDREFVRKCIQQLPENYRTVLLLRDIEELSTDETARALGLSIPVVKTRLHRARQALRTLLDQRFRGETA